MCGIAGFLAAPGRYRAEQLAAQAEAAAAALAHRGPDDSRTWVDAEAGLALGFRRLAIIDPSPEGAQPMVSADGRLVLAFNGEVYNHAELRERLAAAGERFRGRSDTEVLLAAIARWGLEAALEQANGMFALALWDRGARRLALARDRMGQKPLYYGWLGRTFAFASELKALVAHPEFTGDVEPEAVPLLLRYGAVPAPYCIYRGLRKLLPGTTLGVEAGDGLAQGALPEPRAYWSVVEAARRGLADPLDLGPEAAAEALEAELGRAVRACMVSDVPLGAFLSGGIDSSAVVALMQAASPRPVKTFAVGYREAAYDEAPHARAVADHLGTEHHEMTVTAGEAQAVIPELPRIYDEPFADPSQIPTHLVARLARRDVTVALSGDGGDELFAGYNRYAWGRRIERALALAPPGLRAAAAGGLRAVPVEGWDRAARAARAMLPARLHHERAGDKLHKLAAMLTAESPAAMYRLLLSLWAEPTEATPGVGEPSTPMDDPRAWPPEAHFVERMMLSDMVHYLPDVILTKLDRAAMAVGLEGRVPLLDHRVVELVWRLPLAFKLRRGMSKWLLRRVLDRHVPRRLLERPKTGFGVPLEAWLRGDLRDWAEDLLDERALREDGLVEPAPVRRLLAAHQAGRRNWHYPLWAVLMLQAWRREQARAAAELSEDVRWRHASSSSSRS